LIRVLDLTGRTIDVYSKVSDNKLDLRLAGGVYFIQIENDKVKEVQKLIIK
jgi:methylase of polypeptide subunit release factors